MILQNRMQRNRKTLTKLWNAIFRIPRQKKEKKKNTEDRFEFHGKLRSDIIRVSMKRIERKYGTRMNDDSASPCNFVGWRADRQSWWLRNQDPK